MDIAMNYCVNCLRKFSPDTYGAQSGHVYFFIPVTDALDRPFHAYIGMRAQDLRRIFADLTPRAIDLSEYARILHIEEGYWPTEERQEEIRAFHRPLTDTSGTTRRRTPVPMEAEYA
ncbi:MAG: hypothetical protein IT567_04200 [Alphaproteobacteria bacterium]|nr:hypothetical protein [Alphaproteobacteria bacterium]